MRTTMKLLLTGIAALPIASTAHAADNSYNMEIFLHVDNDQEVLHRQCPQAPADRVVVVCSFVVESKERGGLDSHIFAATDDVVKVHGGELNVDTNLIAGGLSDCVQSLKAGKKK